MGILDDLMNNSIICHLRTTEEINTLFDELEQRSQPIDDKLDLDIRMAIQKVKLQQYYESKLKGYKARITMPSTDRISPSPAITNDKKEEKKKSKKTKRNKKDEAPPRIIDPEAVRLPYITIRTNADVDTIVDFFKANEKDLNPITYYWARFNIVKSGVSKYYRQSMSVAFPKYLKFLESVRSLDIHGLSERRRRMIENFKNNLDQFKNNENTVAKVELPVPKKKKESSFEALKTKEWILDWNCVMFKRGYVVIYSRSDLGLKFKPTTVSAPQSIESFNYLKKYLNKRLPPVHCLIRGQLLTVEDKISFSSAILQFAAAARQKGVNVGGNLSSYKITPMRMSFSQALSKANQMSPEEFKKYKSKFIDFLVDHQSKNYKVIPCVERLAHSNSDMTEYAFMFSIECRSGKIMIVYENVNPDRSTLIFLVKADQYNKSIRAIYDFLQSAEINKRSSLRDKDIDIEDIGVTNYRSINHDDLYSWSIYIRRYLI